MRPSRRALRFASVPPQDDEGGGLPQIFVMLRSAASAARLEARSTMAAIFVLFSLVFLAAAPANAALTFPTLTGRVVDDAHVLPADVQASLTQKLADLEQRTSRQLVVVTLPSLQGDDIADYGYQLGRAWKIGQKGINNGTLFIVVPSEHKVRIEVGYGMEPILTDALTSVILQTQVLPKFRDDDIPGGVTAGTDALIQQMGADQSTAEQKAAQAEQQVDRSSHSQGHENPLHAIFSILFVVIVMAVVLGGRRGGGGFWPLLFLGGMMGGGGGRGDDDDFGGGGGGGGFSGGGGSFGGGGSSGSW